MSQIISQIFNCLEFSFELVPPRIASEDQLFQDVALVAELCEEHLTDNLLLSRCLDPFIQFGFSLIFQAISPFTS
ncbi:hypothetical protein AB4144_35585, partial [Rhizobiaceae sp. 2RAB30]